MASFPWDPPPVQPSPQPVPTNSTLPSNVPRLPNSGSNAANAAISATVGGPPGGGDVRVKNEPTDHNNYNPIPPMPANYSNLNNTIATQRAAQNLAQKYGPSAQSQIDQLQSQAGIKPSQSPVVGQQSRPAGAPGNVQLPPLQNDQAMKEYRERQRQQAQQMRNLQVQQQQQRQQTPTQQPQRPPTLASGQVDGASEWDAYVAQRRQGAADSQHADATLRQQLEATSLAMSGGGFMEPLSSHPKRRPAHPQTPSSFPPGQIPQVDGLASNNSNDDLEPKYKDDDDEEDADAITSDLDDPDDNNVAEDDEEEGGGNGQIMVCTYDKVTRLKNKWKCTLKDGVLTTGGKE